jgi:hypothetical protein
LYKLVGFGVLGNTIRDVPVSNEEGAMNAGAGKDPHRLSSLDASFGDEAFDHPPTTAELTSGERRDFERTADCIIDDCLVAMGQVVGTRTTIDYDAIVWLRDRYRAKFLRVLHIFGDRWIDDRHNVTSVAFMLGERAVRYAAHRASINVEAVQRASADVERHCQLHAKRQARALGVGAASGETPLIAGYWCTF